MSLEQFVVNVIATPEGGIALAIVFFGLRWLNASPLGSKPWFRRALPLLPEPFALIVVFLIPGAGGGSIAARIALAGAVAFTAQKIHKVHAQTVMGNDPRLQQIEKDAG